MNRIHRARLQMFTIATLGGTLAAGVWLTAKSLAPASQHVVEIRVYTLKPGVRDGFHRRFVQESLPLLTRAHVDVVAYGPSLHDDVSYFLMRAYPTLTERTRSEDAFYGSREWINGPRDAVIADISSYSTVVVTMSDEALEAFREVRPTGKRPERPEMELTQGTGTTATGGATERATDIATLLALNDDYIRAVQTSNVQRFRELLADDFLCSMSNGTQVDRNTFLAEVAKPPTITELEAHDVNVRVMGDFALVHARTTFRTADGHPGASRYTDTWARRNGRWVAVAAQITRY